MFASQGRRRFKSNKYRAYQHHIQNELRDVEWPFESDQLIVSVDAGVSNRGADVDNVIKPILDTYQSVFDAFNDNKVYRIVLNKLIVPKTKEYITVELTKLES